MQDPIISSSILDDTKCYKIISVYPKTERLNETHCDELRKCGAHSNVHKLKVNLFREELISNRGICDFESCLELQSKDAHMLLDHIDASFA